MEEKKERTVERAREYFHEHGYRGSSLSELIADIGISKPTFYNYFKNKEELFNTVMLETYNEFHYQYTLKAKSASNAMEKLDLFVTTYAWFLDTYPIFRDLFKPGNDLMERWSKSRQSKEFFSEGVEFVRSILDEGIEEGIFSAAIDTAEHAVLLFYVVLTSLSTDPNIFRRDGKAEYTVKARTLVDVLGRGILARPTD